jgi:hypothetical protein
MALGASPTNVVRLVVSRARRDGESGLQPGRRVPGPSLCESQGKHLPTGCVERRPARVGEAHEETGRGWRRLVQGPAVAPRAHSHQRTKVRRTMTTGPRTRPPDAKRHRHWQWQSTRQSRQPPLLVFDQGCRSGTPRKAHRQSVAQAKQFVVPALTDIDERQQREVGVLLLEPSPNQGWTNRDFGRWLWPGCDVGSLSSAPNPKDLSIAPHPSTNRHSSRPSS